MKLGARRSAVQDPNHVWCVILTAQADAKAEKRPLPQRQKPLRADAQRNRDKLVKAAAARLCRAWRRHLARRDRPSAQASASARSTGISRRASIWSRWSIGVRSRRCAAAADDLAQKHPPDVALAEWMQRFVDYIAAKRGMADSLQAPARPAIPNSSPKLRAGSRLRCGASSMPLSPKARSAPTSKAPTCCMRLSGIYGAPADAGLARPIPPARFAPHGWPALGLGQSHRKPIVRADTRRHMPSPPIWKRRLRSRCLAGFVCDKFHAVSPMRRRL